MLVYIFFTNYSLSAKSKVKKINKKNLFFFIVFYFLFLVDRAYTNSQFVICLSVDVSLSFPYTHIFRHLKECNTVCRDLDTWLRNFSSRSLLNSQTYRQSFRLSLCKTVPKGSKLVLKWISKRSTETFTGLWLGSRHILSPAFSNMIEIQYT